MKRIIISILALVAIGIYAADYTPVSEEAIAAAATVTAVTAVTVDASGAVEGATLGIEDGTADGYFERVEDALNWVEGGVTNAIVADVTS
jgi:hypothetical protein